MRQRLTHAAESSSPKGVENGEHRARAEHTKEPQTGRFRRLRLHAVDLVQIGAQGERFIRFERMVGEDLVHQQKRRALQRRVETFVTQARIGVGEINGETVKGERPDNSGLLGFIWESPSTGNAFDGGIRWGISSVASDWELTLGWTFSFSIR